MSTYRGAGSPIAGDITTLSLEDLDDVKDSLSPLDGQVLTYDTTNGWQNETSSSGVTDHTLLSNIGSNTHTAIDSHLANTSNPHSVDSNDVGAGSALWNANRLQGKVIDTTVGTPSDGDIIVFRSSGNDWILESKPAGGGISNVVEDTSPTLGGGLNCNNNTLSNVNEIRGANGGATDATYTFESDHTTGMYGGIGFVRFATDGSRTLEIESNGTLNVAGVTNYETLVTADDDIPNKKFVDDHTWTESDITDLGSYETADATILKQADVDDTPVNGVTTAPVSSNWAFDHQSNSSNPHSVSATQVGRDTAQWNADELQGSPLDVSVGSPTDGKILVYRNSGNDWILEDKPASGSNPALNDITDVTISSVIDGQILTYDTTNGWQNETPVSGVTDHILLSNIGTNTHAQIDTHLANTANPHSVNATDVGLGNVDNTTDLGKPISTATQTALNGKSGTSHTHTESDIIDLGNYETADATILKQADVDDVAVNGVTTAPISSNWAFDHENNTSNPHSVSASNVGNTTAQWNSDSLRGSSLDTTVGTPSDGDILVFRSAGNDWILETKPTGGGGISNIVEDTTPQLGGNLDLNGNTIGGASQVEIGYTNGVTSAIQTQLNGKSPTSHTHTESDITDLQSYLLNITSENLNNLSDLTITSPAGGELLSYESGTGDWINRTAEELSLSEFGHVHNANIQVNSGTSHTLTINDGHRIVEMTNSSANTVTVPPNSSVAFLTGTIIYVTQMGTGQTTIVEGSGVTIRTAETLILNKQYAVATLYKRGTNEWVLSGYLQAA